MSHAGTIIANIIIVVVTSCSSVALCVLCVVPHGCTNHNRAVVLCPGAATLLLPHVSGIVFVAGLRGFEGAALERLRFAHEPRSLEKVLLCRLKVSLLLSCLPGPFQQLRLGLNVGNVLLQRLLAVLVLALVCLWLACSASVLWLLRLSSWAVLAAPLHG